MPVRRSNKPPPPGYEKIEPIIEALENELRDKVKESNLNKRNTESIWPIHQINWQRSRYVYDMYYTHNQISKRVYDYCLKNKFADAGLIAKWKKPGYERLCSTYVINPANYKFGTTSICRVPVKDRGENAKKAQDPTTGCLGCASGDGAGPSNIFGNKYGQNLAAVQMAREKRIREMEVKRQLREEEEERRREQEEASEDGEEEELERGPVAATSGVGHDQEGESETDDDTDDEDDYGPSPAAGVWAGSKKLEAESEALAEDPVGGGDEETNANTRPRKKLRAE
jgi:bud site selection protein 31